MTAGDFALFALGALLAALALWALWPRTQRRAGPSTNWQQRSGGEVRSTKTSTGDDFDSRYLAAWDGSSD